MFVCFRTCSLAISNRMRKKKRSLPKRRAAWQQCHQCHAWSIWNMCWHSIMIAFYCCIYSGPAHQWYPDTPLQVADGKSQDLGCPLDGCKSWGVTQNKRKQTGDSWEEPCFLKAKTMVTRSAPRIEFTSLFQVQNPNSYCWWTKSCTTKDDDYPIVYRILTIPGGGGFLPSTVACGSNPSISWLPALWVGRSWSTNWRETGGRCVTSVFTHCVSQCVWRIVPFCKWVSNHHL